MAEGVDPIEVGKTLHKRGQKLGLKTAGRNDHDDADDRSDTRPQPAP